MAYKAILRGQNASEDSSKQLARGGI